MYCKKCGKETEAETICRECLKEEYTEKQSQNPETENAETEMPLPDADDGACEKAVETKKTKTRGLVKAILSVLLGAIGFVASYFTVGFAAMLNTVIEEPAIVVYFFPMIPMLLWCFALDLFIVLPALAISSVMGVMSTRTFCLNVETETVATVILGIIGTLFGIVTLLMLVCPFIVTFV